MTDFSPINSDLADYNTFHHPYHPHSTGQGHQYDGLAGHGGSRIRSASAGATINSHHGGGHHGVSGGHHHSSAGVTGSRYNRNTAMYR